MFKKSIICALVSLSFVSTAFGQTQNEKPFSLWLGVGGGLSAFSVGNSSDSSFKFSVEAGGAYYFSPNVGVFIAPGISNYELEEGIAKAELSYLDIPFGVSFKYGSPWIPNAKNMVNFGAMYSVATSDLEFSGGGFSADFDAENTFGLYIGSLTTFPVNETLDVGFGTSIKFPFTDIVEDGDVDAFSVNFNLVVLY